MNRKLLSRHLVVSLSFCRAVFCIITRHLQQIGECCCNFYHSLVFLLTSSKTLLLHVNVVVYYNLVHKMSYTSDILASSNFTPATNVFVALFFLKGHQGPRLLSKLPDLLTAHLCHYVALVSRSAA